MNHYRTLLVATDLSQEAYIVAERAQSVAQHHGSHLHILHVLEPLNSAFSGDILLDLSSLQTELEDQAKQHLQKIAAHFYIPDTHQHLVVGTPVKEVNTLAEKVKADLVVIGSHGRSGWSRLLGSTANKILQASKCDVLAVRVGQREQ